MTVLCSSSFPVIILKHGALGDFFLALAAMQSIRQYHQNAPLVLVTSPNYIDLAKKTNYFQEIWSDARKLTSYFPLLIKLNRLKQLRVYDLQNSRRTKTYYYLTKLFKRNVQWSGILPNCTFPYTLSDQMESVPERFKKQLERAGVPYCPTLCFDFLIEDVSKKLLNQGPLILLMPGCSKHRFIKRWPLKNFLEVAVRFQKRGFVPIFLGGPDEEALNSVISKTPFINLIGKTSIGQVAQLIQHAQVWVGNDTGLTHLASLMGCPVVIPWSCQSAHPSIFSPQANNAFILSVDNLNYLEVESVEQAMNHALNISEGKS